jgi:8-oxo-dGTP pyrophosphatase MutT (NUDIX family)
MLSFSTPAEVPEGACKEMVNHPDRSYLRKLIHEFEASRVLNYCVCSDDPDGLFGMFTSCFVEMEAAGGFVRDNAGRYLFIKRFGKWDIPKGKIEAGESPAEAAIREVMEECGIEKPVLLDALPTTYHTYVLDGQRILKKTWWFSMLYEGNPSTKPQKEEGITEAVWLKPSQFDIILENTYRSLYDLIGEITWK